ncbi:hypothetical protein FNF07_02355 [Trinickia caryophylli]|nr:hypothetical protein C0Z17_18595 [Trinickia caryophylli]TRX20162.1 hypothetical protein FNF07_02355 [Trinickia caryophylli]
MRAQVFAIAIAGALVGTVGSLDVEAQTPQRRGAPEPHPSVPARRNAAAQRQHGASAASAPIVRTNTLLDFDSQQRDGHLTPEERRLLRQHIEDAVREIYKR